MDMLSTFYKELNTCYAQGELRAVEQFLLEHTREDASHSRQLLIAANNELGSFYRGTSRFERSVAAFSRAAELMALERGREGVEYATVLNNMAGTYRLMGEYDRAMSLFRTAAQLYEGAGAQRSYPYASVLNNMALVYREKGQLQQAIRCLEGALERIQTMPQCRQETAVTYNNLAALYQTVGDTAQANRCIQRAMEMFERCAEDENVHYAAGLNSLAGLVYAEGDWERSVELYRKAAAYTKRFFGENVEYAAAFQNMGQVYQTMGNSQQAVDCLRCARDVYRKLLPEEDERLRSVEKQLYKLQMEGKA